MMTWWINFARGWLKLPEGNPKIPGNNKSVRTWNPGKGYLSYQLLGFWLSNLILAPISLGMIFGAPLIMFAMQEDDAPFFLALLITCAVATMGLFFLGIIAFNYATVHLELDMLRYTLTDQAIRLRRGVMLVEEVTLSYVNIQNVKYSQGPIQRYFGIADLFVETAGGGGGIQAQQQGQQMLAHQGLIKGISDPEELRDLILERVRQAKGSGLGDIEDVIQEKATATSSAGVIDSVEGQELLKEIRATLASLNQDLQS